MNSPRGAVERILQAGFGLAFWLPLLVCTWLALTPSPPAAVFRVSDVLLHGLAFSYLTFALGLAHNRLGTATIALWMLGYGLLIEVLQSFQPERVAELKDLLVDAAGVAVGLGLLWLLGGWCRRIAGIVVTAMLPAER